MANKECDYCCYEEERTNKACSNNYSESYCGLNRKKIEVRNSIEKPEWCPLDEPEDKITNRIVQFKKAKNRILAGDDVDYLLDLAIQTIMELQNNDGWIPCSERLPECENGSETGALLYQIGRCIYVGYFGRGGNYRDNYFRTYTDVREGVDARDVIAWRPLPEPYKEGDKSESNNI